MPSSFAGYRVLEGPIIWLATAVNCNKLEFRRTNCYCFCVTPGSSASRRCTTEYMSVNALFSVRYRQVEMVRGWLCSMQYDYKDAKNCLLAPRTSVCVCVCARACMCVRARARVCVRACVCVCVGTQDRKFSGFTYVFVELIVL